MAMTDVVIIAANGRTRSAGCPPGAEFAFVKWTGTVLLLLLGRIAAIARPVAADGVAWSVRVSVCWSRSWALQNC